jgi:hypothetical protein
MSVNYKKFWKVALRSTFSILSISVFAMAFSIDSAGVISSPANKFSELQISIDTRDKLSGGEASFGKLRVVRNGNTQELIFRLESSDPSLVKLSASEIKLGPKEDGAIFNFQTVSTPIKSNVTIKAFLQPADQIQAQSTIEVVPALLKSVALSHTQLNGTHGAKIDCKVELRAAAPIGGIELNLSLYIPTLGGVNKFIKLNIPNPVVPASKSSQSFAIEYDDIHGRGINGADDPISELGYLEDPSRSVELVVSIEPQLTKPWQAIPGMAGKVVFNVLPLRVASISAQPSSVSGGSESLATLTLNFSPGDGEKVRLAPLLRSSSGKVWARLLGTSCQSNVGEILEMPLVKGTATYSFKICTSPVTAATTQTVSVFMRSGHFPLQITVQP